MAKKEDDNRTQQGSVPRKTIAHEISGMPSLNLDEEEEQKEGPKISQDPMPPSKVTAENDTEPLFQLHSA